MSQFGHYTMTCGSYIKRRNILGKCLFLPLKGSNFHLKYDFLTPGGSLDLPTKYRNVAQSPFNDTLFRATMDCLKRTTGCGAGSTSSTPTPTNGSLRPQRVCRVPRGDPTLPPHLTPLMAGTQTGSRPRETQAATNILEPGTARFRMTYSQSVYSKLNNGTVNFIKPYRNPVYKCAV